MLGDITIDGEDYSVSGCYTPTYGDGWNEPHTPEDFDVHSVKDAYGKYVENWEDIWPHGELGQEVLSELAHQRMLDEEDMHPELD